MVVPTTTLEDGEIEAELMVGAVLMTVTLAELFAVEPELSVAVAVQVIDELTLTSLAETV